MTELLDFYRIAEADEIAVDCFELGSREALSYMDEEGKCYIAIDPLRLHSEREEKIKLAHELGHCETGSFYNYWSPTDLREKREYKADKWAIRHLLPENEMRDAIQNGYAEAWELAELFDVSEDVVRKAINMYYAQDC